MNQNKELADWIYKTKYLQTGESFEEGMNRLAGALSDNEEHFRALQDIYQDQRFLHGGRTQASMGSARKISAFNCYASMEIKDSMDGIVEAFGESLQTLRLGGGIGYDFSTLRPSGAFIKSLHSTSCGPVGNSIPGNTGFMDIFNAGCSTIRSAGHRRGAQMGVLRVDHPDIRHFINAKKTKGRLTNFNMSVAITDKFMHAVKEGLPFDLVFEDTVYETIDAYNLWEEIMRNTWDYAEPGVLFIDTINKKNNLWYCEDIRTTNPCGEQPLPPYGACTLGSFNLTKYIWFNRISDLTPHFDYDKLEKDIEHIVRAMDNVVEYGTHALPRQEVEAKSKRRVGIGVTGLASTLEVLGFAYGSKESLLKTDLILKTIRNACYYYSSELAKEKGSFDLLDTDKFLLSGFMKEVSHEIKTDIVNKGIRNSHLLSIAPTGTISLAAGNVSNSIEPPYYTGDYKRKVTNEQGEMVDWRLTEWCEENYGIVPVSAHSCSVDNHVDFLNLASALVDSSVSKTCNVGRDVTFAEFKEKVYLKAYEGGASGCTTFRDAGEREGIMDKDTSGSACFIDPETGVKSCE